MKKSLPPVTWPGLIAFVILVILGVWLYRRHEVNNAYGKVIVAQSLSMAMMGRQQVEAVVLNDGALPKNAEEAGFTPIDQPYGPQDRVVRLRLDMLDAGQLKLRYDGWQFHDATLTLVPRIEGDTLKWKCSPSGIPSAWIKDWCFQIEERGTKLGAPPESQIAAAAAAARQASAASTASSEPTMWEPPFVSRGPLSGDGAVIAEGLRQLAPFQQAAQDYFSIHNELPSGGAELESKYTPEQLQLSVMGHDAHIDFGAAAEIYLQFQGFGDSPFKVTVTPMISSTTGRLEWRCRASADQAAVEMPPECTR
jgi:hypothetical protein